MKDLFMAVHLGLGDSIILNGLVRNLATNHRVIVPAKAINFTSVSFMFRDSPNIEVVEIEGDEQQRNCAKVLRQAGKEVLGLGFFGKPPFDIGIWDKEFYRQAGVDWSVRKTGFKVERQRNIEILCPEEKFAFAHDDASRGIKIDPERLPKILTIRPTPGLHANIFEYWALIANATEIHCIDSSFAILADSIPTRAERLVLHGYARPGAKPTYLKPWEILK